MELSQELFIADWQMAERFAAAHMITLGFDDAVVSAAGPDGGIDVVAENAYAQVKHHVQPVGSPAVQQLMGISMSRPGMPIFYSLTGYTRSAVQVGESSNIPLFSYTSDGAVGAWTQRARDLQETGYIPTPQGEMSLAVKDWHQATTLFAQRVLDMYVPIVQIVYGVVTKKWGELNDSGAIDPDSGEFLSIKTQIDNSMQRIDAAKALAEEMDGRNTWNMTELIGKIVRLERYLEQLANMNGIDYRQIESETLGKTG